MQSLGIIVDVSMSWASDTDMNNMGFQSNMIIQDIDQWFIKACYIMQSNRDMFKRANSGPCKYRGGT